MQAIEQTGQSTRAGMALVLVLGFLVLVISGIFISVQYSVAGATKASGFDRGLSAMQAVTAVLLRRERDVSRLAERGDAANFSQWTDPSSTGHENYGIDFVGNFEVRWKIEPARTAPNKSPSSPEVKINYLVNPSPDPNYTPTDPRELTNAQTYLYRVSAQASAPKASGYDRAQGVRFVTITRTPLFKYVLYYVQDGPLGDLELSHADEVKIKGGIYSNGSVYLGSGLKVNDKLMQRGSIDASLTPSGTLIGPDSNNGKVSVRGFEGVFRLSKPLMFAIVNGLPLTNQVVSAAGSPVGTWEASTTYSTANELFPGESSIPAGSDVTSMTSKGTIINPYRILNGSGAVTFGNKTTNSSYPTGSDNLRVINGRAMVGSDGSASGNDSRDAGRSNSFKWPVVAESVFENYVRTQANSMIKDTLLASVTNRPLEPQALRKVEVDGDPTTVDHEYFRPLFVKRSDGLENLALPDTAAEGRAIEKPAFYISNAMGENNFMVRKANGSGWDIRQRSDDANPPSLPDNVGLIIRERPVPDVDYWPTTTNAGQLVPSTSPRYMPYAYGKHWYPLLDPFTVADVSDNLLPNLKLDGGSPAVRLNIGTTLGFTSYLGGGQLTIEAAANPGPSWADSTGRRSGDWNGYPGSSYYDVQNKQYYHRDPWKFVHLNQIRAAATPTEGMHLVCYQDTFTRDDTTTTGVDASLPFSGQVLVVGGAQAKGDVTVTSGALTFLASPAPSTFTGNWSCRWMGQLLPSSTGSYTFSLGSIDTNHRVRIWVGSQMALERNVTNAAAATALQLIGNKAYPFVVELAAATPGPYTGAAPTLRWSLNGATATAIPTAAILRPAGMVGFPQANFSYVECRIDNPQGLTGPAAAKFGLMVRPDAVASPLLQGGSAYGMVGWSSTRGFFTQRRQAPTTQDLRIAGSFYVGDATGATATGTISSLAGTERKGSLRQVNVTSATTQTTYPTVRNNTINYTVQPTVTINPSSVNTGGGVQWELLDDFKIGQYVGKERWIPAKFKRQQKVLTQTLQLENQRAGANFIPGDDGKNLTFYAGGTPATATTTLMGATSMGWRSNGRNWWFSTGLGVVNNTSYTFLSRDYYGGVSDGKTVYTNQPVSSRVPSNPTYADGSEDTFGTATTAWKNGSIRIRKNGTTVTSNNVDDINSFLAASGSSYSITAVRTSLPDVSTSASPWKFTAPSIIYPADSDCDTSDNAPPSNLLTNPTYTAVLTAATFSLPRLSITPYIDANPWITGTGTWFATPQANYLPRGSTWPASWSDVPAWPTTNSFRPDVWKSATAPTVTDSPSGVTGGNGYSMSDDQQPGGWNAATSQEVWLRAVRSGTNITFYGYVGSTRPDPVTFPTGWVQIGNALSIAGWNSDLLVGPCVQSGSAGTVARATFTDLKVVGNWTVTNTPDVNGDGRLDAIDWDRSGGGGADNLALYMMSQYQVFFGPHEITEDFFLYRDADGTPLASEDWFFNNREFWSQSRWWDHRSNTAPTNQAVFPASGPQYRLEKDPFLSPATTLTALTNRMLLAKSTVLSLNLDLMQKYLRTRTLTNAEADRVTGVGPTPPTLTDGTKVLSTLFNGLLYAARTNRYPWNPNANPALKSGTTVNGTNPYSPSEALTLPNSMLLPDSEPPDVVNGDRAGSNAHGLGSFAGTLGGVNKLQPYNLDQAPAFKPQSFIHGIRIQRAQSINWDHGGGGTTSSGMTSSGGKQWSYLSTPAFGSSAMSIVTPNTLYVRGGLNVDEHYVNYEGANAYKSTPIAIMGDTIVFQSGSWDDVAFQKPGLVVSTTGVSGGGTLACGLTLPVATNTFYRAGIVTNNQPTTKARIIEGQAAPFIDTIQFMENWSGKTMGYEGSLVVLDARRYTRSFLLDVPKGYGTTPMGISDKLNSTGWLPFFNLPGASDRWNGESPLIYREPNRSYVFNEDFRTNAGTPPFVPFGVTSKGLGGWARVVE